MFVGLNLLSSIALSQTVLIVQSSQLSTIGSTVLIRFQVVETLGEFISLEGVATCHVIYKGKPASLSWIISNSQELLRTHG
jgi:hypothetical protein